MRLNDTEFLLPNATITRGDLSRIATEMFLLADEKVDAGVLFGTSLFHPPTLPPTHPYLPAPHSNRLVLLYLPSCVYIELTHPPTFLYTATEGDESVIGYLKYCREQGMNYKAEITDQLAGGLYTYKDKVATMVQVRPTHPPSLSFSVGLPVREE